MIFHDLARVKLSEMVNVDAADTAGLSDDVPAAVDLKEIMKNEKVNF